ncbi:hypothetical protein EKW13_13545 [Salmonella enterica]|nr:hypothetical protein [Salmonella enterica]
MTTITREQAQEIIDAADEVITALAGTNEDVHPDNSQEMIRLYDDLNDHYAPPEVVRELARIALASLEVAPVGEVSEKRYGLVMDGTVDLGGKSTYRIIKGEKAMKRLPLGTKFYIAPPAPVVDADPVVFTDERNLHHIARGRETSLIWGKQNQEVGDIPLYRHAQPVPVDKEFIPKNLDKALGVVGVALPESKEEFNFQIERWIQRLIDRVIRYADEFKEQPTPVVPPAIEPDYKVIKSILPTANPDEYACCIAADMWNACRAVMLQSKYRDLSQPVDPQISEYEKIMLRAGWVMVPVEPTDEMIAAAMNCEDVLFNSDESFCVQFGNIYEAMLAAAPQHEVK